MLAYTRSKPELVKRPRNLFDRGLLRGRMVVDRTKRVMAHFVHTGFSPTPIPSIQAAKKNLQRKILHKEATKFQDSYSRTLLESFCVKDADF